MSPPNKKFTGAQVVAAGGLVVPLLTLLVGRYLYLMFCHERSVWSRRSAPREDVRERERERVAEVVALGRWPCQSIALQQSGALTQAGEGSLLLLPLYWRERERERVRETKQASKQARETESEREREGERARGREVASASERAREEVVPCCRHVTRQYRSASQPEVAAECRRPFAWV